MAAAEPGRLAPPPDMTGGSSLMHAIHLASYRREDMARRGWAELRARYPVLADLDARLELAHIPGQGDFLRLKAGPFDNGGAAREACGALSRPASIARRRISPAGCWERRRRRLAGDGGSCRIGHSQVASGHGRGAAKGNWVVMTKNPAFRLPSRPVGRVREGVREAHLIVVGNEKGGAGKSTVAMHLAIALLRMGKSVGAMDLDLRQRTFGRYLGNRARWCERHGLGLPRPTEIALAPSTQRDLDLAEQEETDRFSAALTDLKTRCDFIIIDAPGADTLYSRLAHSSADTIITPVNDSFIDFDLLAEIDPETFEVGRPSLYSEMVWECRKRKAALQKTSIDWVVMRNRISMLDARNKRRVGEGLKKLSQRIGFRLAPGFAERVIYRELFPLGLTLLDLTESGSTVTFTMSHVAARQELRDLLIVLKLPGLEGQPIPF